MSNLSGYDSEAVGFESISCKKQAGSSCSTQTTEFAETGTASQTALSKDCGSTASPEELNAQDEVLKEYPPPGLNEFLRRVVPAMIEQLDENDKEVYGSSDEEEEETIKAQLLQEILVAECNGAGDHATTVLDLSWSSAGRSLAVSVGHAQHAAWCAHAGLVRVYAARRAGGDAAGGDALAHAYDIHEKNCVSVVRFHHSLAAALAYGTTAGEVVFCNLSEIGSDMQLTSPSGCHGSKRVTALLWADSALANTYLTMQINSTGKRRGASDQILISSGSDGTVNVWQVNASLRIFENVITYHVNGSRKLSAPDISCFDFVRSGPLRAVEERAPADVFVVGTNTGALYLCRIKPAASGGDPVCSALEGHAAYVVGVAFSAHAPGLFVSASVDAELRLYDVQQACPLKVLSVASTVSCLAPVGPAPWLVAVGAGEGVALYDVRDGARLPVEGMEGGPPTALSLNHNGRVVAAGEAAGRVRVWALPPRRQPFPADDYC